VQRDFDSVNLAGVDDPLDILDRKLGFLYCEQDDKRELRVNSPNVSIQDKGSRQDTENELRKIFYSYDSSEYGILQRIKFHN